VLWLEANVGLSEGMALTLMVNGEALDNEELNVKFRRGENFNLGFWVPSNIKEEYT